MNQPLMKRIFLTCSLFLTITAQAQPGFLQLEDIWASPKLYARSVPGFNAMQDGEHYTNSEEISEGSAIIKYAFKTGKAVDTLLKPSQLITAKDTISFDDYKFSKDEKNPSIATAHAKIIMFLIAPTAN
jgi:hypothetical protein